MLVEEVVGSILEVTVDLYYKIPISYTVRFDYKIRISIEALELLKKEYWYSYYWIYSSE